MPARGHHFFHCFYTDVVLCTSSLSYFYKVNINLFEAGGDAMDHQVIVSYFSQVFIPIYSTPAPSAWFFFKIMNVSGAEAVVASASPWVGLGESACLVKPYVDLMTPSELHLTMTSGASLFCHCGPIIFGRSSSQ